MLGFCRVRQISVWLIQKNNSDTEEKSENILGDGDPTLIQINLQMAI